MEGRKGPAPSSGVFLVKTGSMGDLLLCSCHRQGRLITPRIRGVSGEDVSSSLNLTIVQPLNIEKKKKEAVNWEKRLKTVENPAGTRVGEN